MAFICSLARFKWPISASLKVFYMIWAIHYIYYEKVLFSIGTVRQLFRDVLSNFSFIVHGEWLEHNESISNASFLYPSLDDGLPD